MKGWSAQRLLDFAMKQVREGGILCEIQMKKHGSEGTMNFIDKTGNTFSERRD